MCLLCLSPPSPLPDMLYFLQVREITNELAPEPFRWTAEGLLAMQEVWHAVLCLASCITGAASEAGRSDLCSKIAKTEHGAGNRGLPGALV